MTSLKLLAAGLLLTAASMASTVEAQAIRSYTIDMNNAEFRGNNQRILLRQRLNQAYPDVDFSNASLQQVRIFAKSRAGQGQVELLVGNSSRDRAGVPESNGRFASNLARTYHQIRLNPNGVTRGVWQLLLDGNIKVQRIVVRARGATTGPDTPTPGNPYVTLGTGDTTIILPMVEVFNVNQPGVRALRIEAFRNLMVVSRVEVVYNNGTRQLLEGLEGQIFAGQYREVSLNNVHIRRITVTALSVIPFGETARYRILARVR